MITLGTLRTQTAYANAQTPVIIVSKDPDIRALDLQVMEVYPDTTDAEGERVPTGTFKLKIVRKCKGIKTPMEEAMKIRERLFTLANSFAGDETGHIACQLHEACNDILRAKKMLDIHKEEVEA